MPPMPLHNLARYRGVYNAMETAQEALDEVNQGNPDSYRLSPVWLLHPALTSETECDARILGWRIAPLGEFS